MVKKIFGTKSSLQRKVIILYALTAIVPIILIVGISSSIYYQNIMKKTNQWVEENSRQHKIVVNERMDTFQNILFELVTNYECIELANKIKVDNEKNLTIDSNHLKTLLENSVYAHEGIRGITFLAGNGKAISYIRGYGSQNETIWSQKLVQEHILGEMSKDLKLSFIASVNISNSINKKDYAILMGIPVRNLRTREQYGVMVVALDCKELIFEDAESELINNGVSKVVVDSNDKIIAMSDITYINKELHEYKDIKYRETSRILEKRFSIEDTDWTIVNIIDLRLYQKGIVSLIMMMTIITFIIVSIFFLALYFISQTYLSNVKKIAQGIHNYAGTDEEMIELNLSDKDELYSIVRQFNNMKARITELVEKLKKKNEEVKIAATNQKHAEIKALEAQINPHFLYNTLDSINWRAIEHDEEEISDMLGALGSLLRYSISNIDMVVLLRAEISWLDKYVFLQRDRFHNSFECEYDITEDAMDYPIYKMLLQPIIENIILHAFENVKSGGKIQVRAYVGKDEKLCIHIKDNGCGMLQEKLFEIQKEIAEDDSLNSNSIGISNVIHRLRIYYKEQAAIKVYSAQGEGTEFILIIPKVQ